jgi:dethiobiotin synthetase
MMKQGAGSREQEAGEREQEAKDNSCFSLCASSFPLNGVFITGTDTDAGKTVAAAAVLVSMRAAGIDAVPMKPVQTGAMWQDGRMRSPDLAFCLRMAELRPDKEELDEMVPCIYEPACSPHLAAAKAGREISFDLISEAFHRLLEKHESVVVEGAGGLLAPIDSSRTMVDLMSMLKLPVILVSRPGLGAINHSLLSIRELERSNLSLHGIIFCETTGAGFGEIERDNIETIARMGKAKVLGCIGHMPGLTEISPRIFRNLAAEYLPIQWIETRDQK